MLQRLSLRAAEALGLPGPSRLPMSADDSETLVIDVDILLNELGISQADLSWKSLTDYCGRAITPVYHGIQNAIKDDADHYSQLLLNLEYRPDEGECNADAEDLDAMSVFPQEDVSLDSQCPMNLKSSVRGKPAFPHMERPPSRRHNHVQVEHPLFIKSTNPSIPTIIVTPCLPESQQAKCRVPIQDTRFGTQLTVPSHPTHNAVFPPMLPQQPLPPVARKWRWKNGHWHAIVPGLEEQAMKGMYSRAMNTRRKTTRCRGHRSRSTAPSLATVR